MTRMAASAPFCFRLEATRGPHSDLIHRYCWEEHPSPPSSSSAARQLSIGRKKRCWLRLINDLEVSSCHAELRFLGDRNGGMQLVLRDVKSTNGTKLNGKMLTPQEDYQLSNGDLIGVGRTSLRFVKVKHTEPCGDEEETATSSGTSAVVLTPSDSAMAPVVTAAPEVIVFSEDSVEERETSAHSASAGVPKVVSSDGAVGKNTDQPDTEPAHDEVVQKPVKNEINSVNGSEAGKRVTLGSAPKSKAAEKGGARAGGVDEFMPDEATCTTCRVVIGHLDMLEQQAHLNECIGGRVATKTAIASAVIELSSATSAKNEKQNVLKRGNSGGCATRAKKPRKPKASEAEGNSAPKAKKPRKRKRVGDEGDIELALALAPTSKMNKEQQTDMQLAAAKKKLEELDAQMAKLAKRRVNLVKTLDRLERAKEKLRKSQVLHPAKVQNLLDLKAALSAIFPSNRQALADQRASMEEKENVSFAAKRYAPTRWIESEVAIDCEDEKQAELATVAAISMWTRASQQLFGLQRDTLLYRNSVLRAFLSDDEDVDINSIEMACTDDVGNEDADADDAREEESDTEAKPPTAASIVIADQQSDWSPGTEEVPDVVKRVFPNWQQDLAFLQDQTAEELAMALEAMNEAVKQASEADAGDAEPNQAESVNAKPNEELAAGEPRIDSQLFHGDQQRACEFMAQIMTRLIAEKTNAAGLANGLDEEPVIDLASINSPEIDQPQKPDMSAVDAKSEAKPLPSTHTEFPNVLHPENSTVAQPNQPATTPV